MASDWTAAGFVRVFLTFPVDQPHVWADDRLLAWWLRLLVYAGPNAAPWPRDLPPDTESLLVRLGALDPQGEWGYRVHGAAKLARETARRGVAGGTARAANGDRDAGTGRWTPTVVATSVDAGSDAGSDPLADSVDEDPASGVPLAFAGTRWADGGTSDRQTDIEEEGKPSLRSGFPSSDSGTPPAPAPAREEPEPEDPLGPMTMAERVHLVAERGPDDSACDEPELHALHHRWYSGVGWRCVLCERADPRSLKERAGEFRGAHF
jgi:hypothetical protein